MKLNIINNIKAGWRTAMGALILATAATGCADDLPGQYDSYGNSGVNISLTDVGNLPGYGVQSRLATTSTADGGFKTKWEADDAIVLDLVFYSAEFEIYNIRLTQEVTAVDADGKPTFGGPTFTATLGNQSTDTDEAFRQLRALAYSGDTEMAFLLVYPSITDGSKSNAATGSYGTEVFLPKGLFLNGIDITDVGHINTGTAYETSYEISLTDLVAGKDFTQPLTLNFRIAGWKYGSALFVLSDFEANGKVAVDYYYNTSNGTTLEYNPIEVVAPQTDAEQFTAYVHIPVSQFEGAETFVDITRDYTSIDDMSGGTAVLNDYPIEAGKFYNIGVRYGPIDIVTPEANQDYSYTVAADGKYTFTVYTGQGLAAVATAINNKTVLNGTTAVGNDADIVIANNIDVTGTGFAGICTGNQSNIYVGSISGTKSSTGSSKENAYCISGINITGGTNGYVGLVGNFNWGTIKDIILIAPTIESNGNLVGAIAGRNNGGTITNCHIVNPNLSSTGAAYSSSYIGGIAGNSFGTISGCTVTTTTDGTGTIQGSLNNVGGIVGYSGGTVSGNTVTGITVSGAANVGGIVGNNYKNETYIGTVTGNTISGSIVNGSSGSIGGIVGYSSGGKINNNTATKNDVTSNGNVGGIVGSVNGTEVNHNTSTNCDVLCLTTYDSSPAGGIVGKIGSDEGTTVQGNTVEGGSVKAVDPADVTIGAGSAGGIIGWNDNSTCGSVTDATLKNTVSGVTIVGVSYNTDVFCGGDGLFVSPNNNTDGGGNYVNGVFKADGYTYDSTKGEYGTFNIFAPQGLAYVSRIINGKVQLDGVTAPGVAGKYNSADITFTGSTTLDMRNYDSESENPFVPIGDEANPYMGTLTGTSFTISNLNISSDLPYIGFIGVLGTDGSVVNITLGNVEITNTATTGTPAVGAVVGKMVAGSITGVTVKGTSTAVVSNVKAESKNAYAGGLVGYKESGTVSGCSVKLTNITVGAEGDYGNNAKIFIGNEADVFTDNTDSNTYDNKLGNCKINGAVVNKQ